MAIARRFFPAPHTAFSLAELAQIAEAELKSGALELKLADIAPLAEAKPNELSFFTNAKNRKALQETKAGAIIAPLYVAELTNKPLLVTNNPRLGFALVAQRFYPAITDQRATQAIGDATEASAGKGGTGAKGLGDATEAKGVTSGDTETTGATQAISGDTETTGATQATSGHTEATSGAKSQRGSPNPPKIDPTATVHPAALVEEGAEIGPHCHIGYGSYIGHNCQLGKGVVISEQVRISHSVIGDGAVIHSHTSVGEEGFGFAVSKKGEYVTLPHLGKVTIGARTVIASGCTIIRGTMADTIIGEDCRLDTQIQVAHNVVLGRGVIISAQVGISGSTSIGDYTRIGGHVGIMGHLQIGSRVNIFPKSGVMENIADGMQVGGAPAIPLRDFLKYARRRK